MTGLEQTQKWRALIRDLRKHFPVAQEVTIRRRVVSGKKTPSGLTIFNGRSYWVRVKANQDWQGQVDALLHEWAHVRCIEEAYNHGAHWATTYGEIYNVWTRDFTTDN